MDSYLLHDANAGNNFKIMMMIQKEGMKGYGIYWMLLEFLRLQNGYKASAKRTERQASMEDWLTNRKSEMQRQATL